MDANTARLAGAAIGAALGYFLGKKYESDEDSNIPLASAAAGGVAGYFAAPHFVVQKAAYNSAPHRKEPVGIAELQEKLGDDGSTDRDLLEKKQVVDGIVRFGPAPDNRNSVGGF